MEVFGGVFGVFGVFGKRSGSVLEVLGKCAGSVREGLGNVLEVFRSVSECFGAFRVVCKCLGTLHISRATMVPFTGGLRGAAAQDTAPS